MSGTGATRLGFSRLTLSRLLPIKALGGRLQVLPAECLACGFIFRDRKRFTRPGTCPQCRATRIDPPAFRIGA
jgi:predicted Zn-ribbon and HTH transcriptional regulator